MNLAPGKVLGGRYQIIGLLGQGNFGETYLAEDLHARRRKCVVKFLKFASNNPDIFNKAKDLFEREAEVLLKLSDSPKNHQLPRFLAYFDENQYFYLIQEFIEGHSLREELQQKERLNEDEVVELLEDVLKVLAFIHSEGLIHRDIKPDNLLRRDRDGKIVLIDFGAVKEVVAGSAITKLQTKPTLIYTQGYAPPEQHQGNPQFNSDIYALGMTALEALTGLEPEYLQSSYTGKFTWYGRSKISAKLAKIIEKMLDEDYKRRYQSADDVIDAIKKIKNTQIVSAITLKSAKYISPSPLWLRLAVFAPLGIVIVTVISFLAIRALISSIPTTSDFPSKIELEPAKAIPSKAPVDTDLKTPIQFKRANPKKKEPSQAVEPQSTPSPSQDRSDFESPILFKRSRPPETPASPANN